MINFRSLRMVSLFVVPDADVNEVLIKYSNVGKYNAIGAVTGQKYKVADHVRVQMVRLKNSEYEVIENIDAENIIHLDSASGFAGEGD